MYVVSNVSHHFLAKHLSFIPGSILQEPLNVFEVDFWGIKTMNTRHFSTICIFSTVSNVLISSWSIFYVFQHCFRFRTFPNIFHHFHLFSSSMERFFFTWSILNVFQHCSIRFRTFSPFQQFRTIFFYVFFQAIFKAFQHCLLFRTYFIVFPTYVFQYFLAVIQEPLHAFWSLWGYMTTHRHISDIFFLFSTIVLYTLLPLIITFFRPFLTFSFPSFCVFNIF